MNISYRISDPQEHHEIERAKLATTLEEFMARRISDAVFEASLYALGYRGQNLRVEYRFRWDERYRAEQARAGGSSMREFLLRAAPNGVPDGRSLTVIVRGRLVRWNSDGSVETVSKRRP